MSCNIKDISLTIHPHPTLSESIKFSSELYEGIIAEMINKKLNK